MNQSIFKGVKLGIEDARDKIMRKEAMEKNEEIDFIAPGRSNRDYDFLCKVWKSEWGKLLIVCDTYKAKTQRNDIEILNNCFGDDYLKKLCNVRYGVIVPLRDEKISSGQLVFLQAAMFGKPVIATYNKTVEDYVTDNENGIIIDKSCEALEKAINVIKNPRDYSQLSSRARKKFENEFSLLEVGKTVGRSIE